MNLLKKSICLLNRQIVNKPIFTTNRLYSDEKSNSVEVAKNVEQIQINEKPERHSYNKAVENHFETGISITSYNTVICHILSTISSIQAHLHPSYVFEIYTFLLKFLVWIPSESNSPSDWSNYCISTNSFLMACGKC